MTVLSESDPSQTSIPLTVAGGCSFQEAVVERVDQLLSGRMQTARRTVDVDDAGVNEVVQSMPESLVFLVHAGVDLSGRESNVSRGFIPLA